MHKFVFETLTFYAFLRQLQRVRRVKWMKGAFMDDPKPTPTTQVPEPDFHGGYDHSGIVNGRNNPAQQDSAPNHDQRGGSDGSK